MADFDDFVPQFLRAKERWSDAPLLAQHYLAVKGSYEGSSQGIIASIKSFIECVCITILGEFGKDAPSEASTVQLLSDALKVIGLDKGRGASRFGKLLSAHNRMADALNDMRNENDPIAHGKDGFLDALSENECRAYIITADAILALLLAGYEGTEPDLRYTREPYERFTHFHSKVDRAVSIEATVDSDQDIQTLVILLRTATLTDGVEIRLEPSELLYAIDRPAYVELLSSAAALPQPAIEAEAAQETQVEELPLPAITLVKTTTELVSSYDGKLSALKTPFGEFLMTLGGLEAAIATTKTELRDSLLAAFERCMGLDWIAREPLQASMRVAFRRILVKFGVQAERAEQTAERLLAWLKNNAATLPETVSAA